MGVHSYLDPILLVGLIIAALTAPSVLLTRRGAPLSALSWIFASIALPIVGPLTWWLIGRTGLSRPKKRRARRAQEFARRRRADHRKSDADRIWRVPHAARQAVFRTEGNCAHVYLDGPTAFAAMEAAMEAAQTSIHALFYICNDDETANRWLDLLIVKAKAGVTVRFLLDRVGSSNYNKVKVAQLRAAGGQVAFFMVPNFWSLGRPTFNFRNHRKILVVDHTLAFTGGMNVGNEYAKNWEDVQVEVRGPVVEVLEDVLLDDWFFATQDYVEPVAPLVSTSTPMHCPDDFVSCACTLVASGPDDDQPWMHDAFFRAIVAAQDRIWIATPYFIPSESITTALRTACARGVDVRILVPHKSDLRMVQWASRAYYAGLVSVGARIFEFQPRMSHAKVVVVDKLACTIGSANVDPRSFRLNFEVGAFFQSPELTAIMATWFEGQLRDSREVTIERLRHTPGTRALIEAFAHLFSPLL